MTDNKNNVRVMEIHLRNEGTMTAGAYAVLEVTQWIFRSFGVKLA